MKTTITTTILCFINSFKQLKALEFEMIIQNKKPILIHNKY